MQTANHSWISSTCFNRNYIELDKDIGVEKVCDIFTKINDRGVGLSVFDLINAILRPKEIKLKELWRNAAPRLSFVDTNRMNVYVLQVMSILAQSYCSAKYLYYLIPGQSKTIKLDDGSLSQTILISDKETRGYPFNRTRPGP